MIVDKRPLPDDATPGEAPPAYDTVEAAPLHPPIEKEADFSSTESSFSAPSSGLRALSSNRNQQHSPNWFPFTARSRVAKEVKATAVSILRDVVKLPEMDTSAHLILQSCSEACRSYGLSMASILQEPLMEGHSAIYWAVIKRPRVSETQNHFPDLVSTLLALASPLTDATLSDVRLACLQNSDEALFQQLRRSPAFSRLSGTEEMLLGTCVPPDGIEVEEVSQDTSAFVARFRVPMFQKRMRVSKQINLEFIARGRLWSVKFLVASADNIYLRPLATPGTWVVILSLFEHSPPTWIDSRLIIEDAHAPSTSTLSRESRKPTISLRLKTGLEQLTPTVIIQTRSSLHRSRTV